jgi:ResB-like family
LGILLVFAATLDQTNLGIWGIQQKWFRTLVVRQEIGGIGLPIFPGGYLLGGLLCVNLFAAHLHRFKLTGRKTGIFLTHLGFFLLLVGELLSGLWQEDFTLRLNPGETKSYAESFRFNELAVVDATGPEFDQVVAIPEIFLERPTPVQHPKLPFRVIPRAYYPNSTLQLRVDNAQPPVLATAGLGLRVAATPQPITYRADETNLPSAYIEVSVPEASIGIFLVSTGLVPSQEFEYAGRIWKLSLRPKRSYRPFALTLLEFSHDRYRGTEIPKNIARRIQLTGLDGQEKREVLISMNHPLRYAGLTFYQAGFENNDRTSILQVVRNPSWQLPYLACALMGLGLLVQFGLHLFRFIGHERPAKPA